jgi:dihydroflavonol-4-reductase
MAQTVLVTGGSGFVAGWCIVELLRRGYTVRTTLRSLAKEPAVRVAIASATDAGEALSFHAADLNADSGWDAAMDGCEFVLHVASPLGTDGEKDPAALIAPARDGTLRVLRAATGAGVRRIIMTSAATAATPLLKSADSVSDETQWFDPQETIVGAYRISKRLAERAAWDFMQRQRGTDFSTILPGAVFGPILGSENLGSVQVIGRLLQGRVAGNPRLGFEVVDVRDLATVHILAMTSQHSPGERFLATGEFLWMAEISRILREHLGDAAGKVPTRVLPDFVLRAVSLFDPGLRFLTPSLGRKHVHSTAKAQRMLGWQSRPARETLVDCAKSLIASKSV